MKKTYSILFSQEEFKALEQKAFRQTVEKKKRVAVAHLIRRALQEYFKDIKWDTQ